jgi:hypothetical protein
LEYGVKIRVYRESVNKKLKKVVFGHTEELIPSCRSLFKFKALLFPVRLEAVLLKAGSLALYIAPPFTSYINVNYSPISESYLLNRELETVITTHGLQRRCSWQQ